MMQDVILVLNAGSSSIKFAIFSVEKTQHLNCLYQGQLAGIGNDNQSHFIVQDKQSNQQMVRQAIQLNNHQQALKVLLTWLPEQLVDFRLLAVGHRIVHGGSEYVVPVVINAAVLKDLQALIALAPLHQCHNLSGIIELQKLQPELIQVGCFDTAFHHSIPEIAHTLALPKELYKEGVRSYGFHGLSYEYIVSALQLNPEINSDGRVVIAHLGQGVSLCALRRGKSIATSMTFTPLDGLPMGTRCGSLDPAVILYLLREKKMSADDISELLHFRSGLAGLSGISSDMQVLLNSKHPDAQKAIDIFVYRICCEIGSLAAALGGLETLVFTAGIGEHSAIIRNNICLGTAWLGVDIDTGRNNAGAAKISTAKSKVSVWVIPTNEEKMIASHTVKLALGNNNEY